MQVRILPILILFIGSKLSEHQRHDLEGLDNYQLLPASKGKDHAE